MNSQTQQQIAAVLIQTIENGGSITPDQREELDEYLMHPLCCDGRDCGCRASTRGDEFEHYLKRDNPEAYARWINK